MGLTHRSVGMGTTDCGDGKKKASSEICVAIAGNPNVGKSTVFNALTGMNQHTGNWPGKTVSSARGYFSTEKHSYMLVDIPGTYSLIAQSAEEEVARDFLRTGNQGDPPDATVIVCDACCLERNLNLALQILEITKKVVICVNMLDEAAKKGIYIDNDELSRELSLPVVGIVARKKKGLDGLKSELDKLADCRHEAESTKDREGASGSEPSPDEFVKKAEEICKRVVKTEGRSGARDRRLDKLLTGKYTAYPIMICLLLIIFWITINGAGYPSALLSRALFFLVDKARELLTLINAPQWITGILADGALTVLSWVVSVMLPPMAIFFPMFTILEDSGYLPRIAYNLDRPFQKCKTCGKQALTMCMGFGCNAAGVVGCRIIDSERERMIAMITNSLVPCNGRFPILIAVISMFFVGGSGLLSSVRSALILTALIVFGILMTFLVSRILSATVLRGMPSAFTLELPPYRRPQIGRVIVRSVFDRTLFVLGRAATVAAPAGILIWLMANLHVGNESLLAICSGFLDPFAGLFGLDGVILLAFILGFPASETVIPIMLMAYLSESTLVEYESLGALKDILVGNGWTHVTAICVMIFTLIHWPCSTTVITVKKESGSLSTALLSAVIPTVLGLFICFVINMLSKLFL